MQEPSVAEDAARNGWWRRIAHHVGSPVDRRNQGRFVAWTLAWGVVFLTATWLLRTERVEGAAGWVVAVIPIVVAVGPLAAYLRFLRQADELMRRIQLEALAFGFAAGVVFSVGYQLFERAGAPEIAFGDQAVVMLVAYSVGTVIATAHYR